jgi:predicted nucleotidyltransferase
MRKQMRSSRVVHVAPESLAGTPSGTGGIGMQKFTEPRFIKPVSLCSEDRQKIAESVRSILASSEDIVFAYIYGSFARGESVRDLDVALYTTEDKDFLFAIDIAVLLRRDTGFEVDVTVMNHAPVALQFAILRDGVLLLSKDEALRTALIERVSRQYREYTHFRDLFLGVAGARSGQDR